MEKKKCLVFSLASRSTYPVPSWPYIYVSVQWGKTSRTPPKNSRIEARWWWKYEHIWDNNWSFSSRTWIFPPTKLEQRVLRMALFRTWSWVGGPWPSSSSGCSCLFGNWKPRELNTPLFYDYAEAKNTFSFSGGSLLSCVTRKYIIWLTFRRRQSLEVRCSKMLEGRA